MTTNQLSFDASATAQFIQPFEWSAIEPQVMAAARLLDSRKGPGNEFLGWLDLPVKYDRAEYRRLLAAAKRIQKQAEVLVVIGIGGSYLGAKAALDFCGHHFHNNLTPKARHEFLGHNLPEIYFAGTNLSSAYLTNLIELIGDRSFAINVISKSGTTTEPAIAFRLFKKILESKYGVEEARKRIYATTDSQRGALKTLADQEGYEIFVVPDDVGGRFSVLTSVGLLPVAVAGIDTGEMLRGAADARARYKTAPFENNDVLQYVAARNILLRKGKEIELMVNYEPRLHYVAEWWKQLFGESEGKDGKGIFPASVDFTSDLHSMGQYIQDGRRHLFETVLELNNPGAEIMIEEEAVDLDGLNYLVGCTLDEVNKKAAEGTRLAHLEGGVPNLSLRIPAATPYHLGGLFYFFEKSCAISGYLLGVNPFDQPGVEAYKKNMFRLLGKKS